MDYRAIQKDLHDTGNMHNMSIDKLRMFYLIVAGIYSSLVF
jgi:hypothetical protein